MAPRATPAGSSRWVRTTSPYRVMPGRLAVVPVPVPAFTTRLPALGSREYLRKPGDLPRNSMVWCHS
jgi:hypothetical protein